MTCPGSATGTAVRGRGPYNDDWSVVLDPADYIPITNIKTIDKNNANNITIGLY